MIKILSLYVALLEMFVIYGVLVILFFPFIYWCYCFYIKYKDFRKLPGPKPLPILGNLLPYNSVGVVKKLEEFYKEYKPRYVFYTGFTPSVYHSNPEHIRYLLNSTVHINKSDNFQILSHWLAEGIITSNGNKWRQRRKIISQSLSLNNIEPFLKVLNKIGDTLIKVLEGETEKKQTNILEFVTYSSLDTVLETMMGVSLNTQENRTHSYVNAVKDFLHIVGIRMFSPIMRNETLFLMFSKHKDEYLRLTEDLKKFTENVINKKVGEYDGKDKNNTKSEDGTMKKLSMMDSLIEDFTNGRIDYEGVREEIDTFMAAGHETTAGLLAFILYELAHNQEVQKKLYEEIVSIAPSGDFTKNHLADMTYLEMVIKEVLRLHPVVPFVERKILDPFELDGIRYPAGTIFGIPIWCLQRDPEYFPNPDVFDPMRFSPENIDRIPKYVYLPFSAGPRLCIGYKFATWTTKCIIAKCIREYAFSPAENFQMEVEYQITLKPANGTYCVIRRR